MDFIQKDWNETASAYEKFNTAPDSYSYQIEWPTIREMLPDLKGKRVMDIGCGTGIFTFLLEQYAPEELVGLDLSEAMLDIAKKKAASKQSEAVFLQGDATYADRYVEKKFDFLFSSTTTHYLENLPAFFNSLKRCLNKDGSIILSVIHPVYTAMYPLEHGDSFPEDEEWIVRYLDKSRRAYIQPWIEYNDECENRLSRSFHHLLGDYINAISQAGFKIERMEEPMPPAHWKTECPGRYESYLETPTYLIMKLVRDRRMYIDEEAENFRIE